MKMNQSQQANMQAPTQEGNARYGENDEVYDLLLSYYDAVSSLIIMLVV